MPELPEITALAAVLNEQLRGARIHAVAMRSVAALKTFDPPIDALRGLTFAGATRHGKFLDLSAPPLHLIIHLARAGWIRLLDKPTNSRPSLRGPLALSIAVDDGRALEVTEQGTDKRLAVYVVHEPSQVPGIARLGPDALDPAFTTESLAATLRREQGTVKSVLADQAVIAGIGNAYSDEILHRARMSPFRRAATLDDDEIAALHEAMQTVLREAIAQTDGAAPAKLKQEKKAHLLVHGRTGQPCPVCGETIRQVALASRSFQYCPGCQTGGKIYADRRLSRLLR